MFSALQRPLRALALLAGLAAACTSTNQTSSVPDASGADSGICCPPDSQPSCCMKFGGTRKNGTCPGWCDGIPVPSDPNWKLQTNADGCPEWTHPQRDPPSSAPNVCGKPVSDAGSDGAKDAATDAATD